jgi:hypothetical protein
MGTSPGAIQPPANGGSGDSVVIPRSASPLRAGERPLDTPCALVVRACQSTSSPSRYLPQMRTRRNSSASGSSPKSASRAAILDGAAADRSEIALFVSRRWSWRRNCRNPSSTKPTMAIFRAIGLQPGEVTPPPELRRALTAWMSGRSDPWAERLDRVAQDEQLAQYCEALPEREARKWDGRSRDPRTGRPVGHVRLGILSMQSPRIDQLLQWAKRLPERAELRPLGGQIL